MEITLHPMRSRLLQILVLASTVAGAAAVPAEDGLYAVFQTSRGEFTAALEFEKVPVTVANFVGLAEGTRGWIDPAAGTLRRAPFYNGLTFHRIIPGFMAQSGSLNGLGTDGPGYAFGDEFHTTLAHNSAGVLSMANSGANSNGAQFFITLAPTDWLDSKHSVFGRVVEGMDVVNAIGATGTPEGIPTGPTTINNVTIVRNGTAAQNFNATAVAGLPEARETPAVLKRSGAMFALEIARSPFTQHHFASSATLASWDRLGSLDDFAAAGLPSVDITSVATGKSREFYRIATCAYAPRPADLVGKSLVLNLASGNQTLRLNITSPEGYDPDLSFGTYSLDGAPESEIAGYFIRHSLPSLYLDVALKNFTSLSFALHFQSETGGWFTSQYFGATDGYWPFFGTFTITAVP